MTVLDVLKRIVGYGAATESDDSDEGGDFEDGGEIIG